MAGQDGRRADFPHPPSKPQPPSNIVLLNAGHHFRDFHSMAHPGTSLIAKFISARKSLLMLVRRAYTYGIKIVRSLDDIALHKLHEAL